MLPELTRWLLSILSITLGVLTPSLIPTTTSSTPTFTTTTSMVVVIPSSTTMPTVTTTKPIVTRTTTTLAAAPADDIWWQLALCEDDGKNRYFKPYSGYFHFLPSTYHSVGGTGMPHEDDYETQKGFAIKLQARDGWNPWPGCARILGLPLR